MLLSNIVPTLSRTARRSGDYFRILNRHIRTSNNVENPGFFRGYSSLTQNTEPLMHSSSFVSTQNNLVIKRYKKSKKAKDSKTKADKDDEEEEDDDALSGENPLLMDDILGGSDSAQKQELDVNSLRLDSVAKVAFRMTRAKIEELFYKGDIYINGERPSKKSCDIAEGDEIDVVRNINPEDHTMVDIKRIQILILPDKASESGRMKIQTSKVLDLTVKNPDPDKQQK